MKKILFALLIILTVNSFCSVHLPSVKADETRIFLGTIESIRPAMGRPPKWYSSMFTAVAESGERKDFWILGLTGSSPTSVVDFDGKPMDKRGYNHKPHVNKKAEIKYSVASNGHNEVILMRYVPTEYVQQLIVPAAPANTPAQTIAHEKNTLLGTVKEIAGIAPGLSNNWTYAKIVFVADSENESAFFVNKNTALIDENGVTNPPLPKKDQRVEVKYLIEGDGRNMAISLRYLLPGPTQQSIASPASNPENIFIGTVKKVDYVLAKSPNWTYNRINVVADNGNKVDFFVMRGTVITDANGNSLSGKSVKKGKKVEIQYSVLTDSSAIINGQKGANSIRYLD